MTAVSNVCESGPHNDMYGAKLESPSAFPGLLAGASVWNGSTAFKRLMLKVQSTAGTVVLTRDKDSGEVRIDEDGKPLLYYPISQHDKDSMLDGMEKAIRLNAAAGASGIATNQFLLKAPSADPLLPGEFMSLPPESDPNARAKAVEDLIKASKQEGIQPFRCSLFSAHQMGSCQMGVDPKRSVVQATGESWEVRGLYVADASVFPTSSGVNPMITTYSVSHMIAQALKRDLADGMKGPPAAPAKSPRVATARFLCWTLLPVALALLAAYASRQTFLKG